MESVAESISSPDEKISSLELIYKRIPAVKCKGKCQQYCGPIAFSPIEVVNVSQRGFALPMVIDSRPEHAYCDALDFKSGKCSIYEARPAICRLYGAAKHLRCEHGCRPSRWLSRTETAQILKDVHELLAGTPYYTHLLGAELTSYLNALSEQGLAPQGGWK